MRINYTKNFLKSYKKRIKPNRGLDARFKERFALFTQNPNDPILKNHRLQGSKSHLHSFSITGDIRVLYQLIEDELYLVDIGTHNQVY
ncbi:MAG TPA: type II toxin-antitoxin system mRNA interferase toxin, RelE/StbE family [Patescibacteria group bacterium]